MRPTIDEYYMEMVGVVAKRGTCARRKVGCILVDRSNRVLATGHNGIWSGGRHCTDNPCPGASAPSGTGLSKCQAIHAETNALLYCSDVTKITTAYVSASPCVDCIKLLLNTSCQRIVFAEEYPHGDSKRWWINDGRIWDHFNHDQGDIPFPR